jgi:hypothetical protein
MIFILFSRLELVFLCLFCFVLLITHFFPDKYLSHQLFVVLILLLVCRSLFFFLFFFSFLGFFVYLDFLFYYFSFGIVELSDSDET